MFFKWRLLVTEEIYALRHELEAQNTEIMRLKKVIRGERVQGDYCRRCENAYGFFKQHCLLDCGCKDFVKSNGNNS